MSSNSRRCERPCRGFKVRTRTRRGCSTKSGSGDAAAHTRLAGIFRVRIFLSVSFAGFANASWLSPVGGAGGVFGHLDGTGCDQRKHNCETRHHPVNKGVVVPGVQGRAHAQPCQLALFFWLRISNGIAIRLLHGRGRMKDMPDNASTKPLFQILRERSLPTLLENLKVLKR
jgi:hypothetical protein